MSELVQILGNEKNLQHLSDAHRLGKLSHAYIISGPKGSGKKSLAQYIAAALLCDERPDPKEGPCGKCPSCIKAKTDNHPDIIHVVHEKPGLISVSEIRQQVVDDIAIKPYYGPYKIYIISDSQYMNEFGQNSLLKTIEEPPSYGIIFLLTDNADGLLDTIRSRCIRLDMDMLPEKLIADILINENKAAPGEAFAAAGFARGNLGLAKELSGNEKFSELMGFVQDILRDIFSKDAFEIYQSSMQLDKQDGKIALDIIRKWFRDVLTVKAYANETDLYFPNELSVLRAQAELLSFEGLNDIMNDIDDAASQLEFAVKAEAVFENMFLRIRRNGKSSRR